MPIAIQAASSTASHLYASFFILFSPLLFCQDAMPYSASSCS